MVVDIRDENGCVPDCEGKQLAIPHTSEYKYLGVMVHEKWDWSAHINYITTKVTKKVNAMNDMLPFVGCGSKTQAKASVVCIFALENDETDDEPEFLEKMLS
eukprot:Awhi_evm1s10488